jgi:kynureninase
LAQRAAQLDAADPLAPVRARFDLPPGTVYLDGNSLGALPSAAASRLDDVVRRQWGRGLIRSWWDHGWWEAPQRVGDRIARLVGAAAGQIVVCDSTSVNLFKVLVAARRLNPDRDEILIDATGFPTDGYMAESAARLTGASTRSVHPRRLAENPAEIIGARTAVVLVNHVDYRTGALWDMPGITEAAHAAGALVIWDVSHSVGAFPVRLDECSVDFAVGCTYKFLNGGPGSPAFLYVPRHLQADFDQPLTGWHSHHRPFDMAPHYEPAHGMARGRSGSPEMLSLLALDGALDAWNGVAIEDVRTKGVALTGFFIDCVDALLPSDQVTVVTPRDRRRGNQVSLTTPGAAAIMDAMIARAVIGDFRPPDVLRFGFAPLYIRFADAFHAAALLGDLVS